jgi:hypothetical protein
MTPEDALRAAARTIGQMQEADIQRKFAELQEARKARTRREILRQQTDSLEGDEAAYQAALKHEEDGDLKTAARWYSEAADHDFPGASLRLARVLDALAAEQHARGENQAAEALNEEALEWCAKAFAAGEAGASEFIEEFDARLDPARCALGGLHKVTALDPAQMAEHFRSCGPCQAEQAEQAARPATSAPTPR